MHPPEPVIADIVAVTRDAASVLHFTPVRLRARIDGWTPERQRRFVAGIALTGRADYAATLCGLSVQSAARVRRRPDAASFDAACCAAMTLAKRLRRARAAGRLEVSKGGPGFGPWGSENSAKAETSARPSETSTLAIQGEPGAASNP